MFHLRRNRAKHEEKASPALPAAMPLSLAEGTRMLPKRLRRWSYGMLAAAVVYALLAAGLQIIRGGISVLWVVVPTAAALAWSYLLRQFSHQVKNPRFQQWILWINGVLGLLIATAMIIGTGGFLSPIFWVYLTFTVLQSFEDPRRGCVTAWLSCILFYVLVITQGLGWMPSEWVGIEWRELPWASFWIVCGVGFGLWYLAVALALQVWYRRLRQNVRELQFHKEELQKSKQDLKDAQNKLVEGEQNLRFRILELDQAKRQFEADRVEWQAQVEQHDAQHAQLLALEQQFEKRSKEWETERLTLLQTLEQRDAALTEQTTALQENQQAFEGHRAQTMKSLAELEQTLLEKIRKVSTEAQRLEKKEDELEQQRSSWVKQQREWQERCALKEGDLQAQTRSLDQQIKEWTQRQKQEQQASASLREAQLASAERKIEEEKKALQNHAQELQESRRVLEQEITRLTQEFERRHRALEEENKGLQAQRDTLSQEQGRLIEQIKNLEVERKRWAEERAGEQRGQATGPLGGARRFLVQQAYRALRQQARHLRDQSRSVVAAQKQSAAREQMLQRQTLEGAQKQHQMESVRQQFELKRTALQEQLHHRETELAERLQVAGEMTQRLKTQSEELERERQKLRQETETAQAQRQRVLRGNEAESAAMRRESEHMQRQVEQQHLQNEKKEKLLAKQLEQLQAREQALIQKAQSQEKELLERFEQMDQLRRELDAERKQLEKQHEEWQTKKQVFHQQERALEVRHSQLEEAQHDLAEASLTAQPETISADLLALLANEFNAPLASSHFLLQTLLEGDHGNIPPGLESTLEKLLRTQQRLRRILDDVLDLARLERGQFPAAMESLSVYDILAEPLEILEKEAQKKDLVVVREGKTSMMLMADPTHAGRILSILFDNAVEYTDSGKITISSTERSNHVVITVTDTGAGIDPKHLASLFTKPKLGALLNGKGIGLYFSRLLAKQMGVEVTLQSSEVGKGSVFAVTFPSAKEPISEAEFPNGGTLTHHS